MAERSEEESASKKSEKKTIVTCVHCKKRVVNVAKCRKCLNSFHPACLEQAAEQKNVQCSHEAVKVRKTSECLVPEELTENELLRTLVKELQSKNQILEENGQLLREKVKNLQDKLQKYENEWNKNCPATSSANTENAQKSATPINKTVIRQKVVSRPENEKPAAAVYENNKSTIDNTDHIIDLPPRCSVPPSLSIDDDSTDASDNLQNGWTEVRKGRYVNNDKPRSFPKLSKSTRPEPRRGTSETVSCLKVATKLTGLFLSGLTPEATADNIMNFLKEKNLENGCHCEKMKTKKQKYFSSFRLSVPQEDIDKYLDTSLWPKGTIISPFQNLQHRLRTTKPQLDRK
nr:unnamed protein product [Callosobruchus analis]